jgi:hypothetical protein
MALPPVNALELRRRWLQKMPEMGMHTGAHVGCSGPSSPNLTTSSLPTSMCSGLLQAAIQHVTYTLGPTTAKGGHARQRGADRAHVDILLANLLILRHRDGPWGLQVLRNGRGRHEFLQDAVQELEAPAEAPRGREAAWSASSKGRRCRHSCGRCRQRGRRRQQGGRGHQSRCHRQEQRDEDAENRGLPEVTRHDDGRLEVAVRAQAQQQVEDVWGGRSLAG